MVTERNESEIFPIFPLEPPSTDPPFLDIAAPIISIPIAAQPTVPKPQKAYTPRWLRVREFNTFLPPSNIHTAAQQRLEAIAAQRAYETSIFHQINQAEDARRQAAKKPK